MSRSTYRKENLQSQFQQTKEKIMSLNLKFVKSDSVQEVLDIAYNINKNVILYGRGGHGRQINS